MSRQAFLFHCVGRPDRRQKDGINPAAAASDTIKEGEKDNENIRSRASARLRARRVAGYRASLYRVALSWCGDAMLADDLTQECLSRAIAKLHQLKDRDKLENWLFRILNNCWREHLRRLHPAEDIEALVLSQADTPELGLHKQQVIDRVRAAVNGLPLGQRQVVTLVDLQEFAYAEVADILEIPVGTVMSRLSRARQTLKQRLLGIQGELSPGRSHLRRVK
jgi:RNA polymerase sigma-70 factor (ECF subfamily)